MIARLLSMLFNAELSQFNVLKGALKTATNFSHHRDPETGAHLDRMAHISRIIALELAPKYDFNDEDIFLFSPLHDVGKIAIPDSILLKPGKLSEEEFELMKTHTSKGTAIVISMLANFQFRELKNLHKLANIIQYHHENIDGSGYPEGLTGSAIPIEARIVAAADVFDALTSVRPYKSAWSNTDAVVELENLTSYKLDPDCVAALITNLPKIVEVQRHFSD